MKNSLRNYVHKHSQNINRPKTHDVKTYTPESPEVYEIFCHSCGAKNFLTLDDFSCNFCGEDLEIETGE